MSPLRSVTRWLVPLALLVTLAPADAKPRWNKRRVAETRALYARPAETPAPADNEPTEARVALGRALFFDPRLSGSRWISCATCHNPGLSYGDGLPVGIGHGMEALGRRTPTVLNLAWASSLMWDGRFATLEEQALGPIQTPGEMNLPIEELEARVASIEGYGPLFEAAYPERPIGRDTIAKAVASFERTLISGPAPFDAWVAGDEGALSAEAKRGFQVFHDADCHQCHAGWRFTDDGYYDIGIADDDVGRGAVIPFETVQHAFKVPTLREVSRRAPYLHDGSAPDLEAVVALYDRGGDARRPSKNAFVRPLGLSDEDRRALVAFLRSLTGPSPRVEFPELPQ